MKRINRRLSLAGTFTAVMLAIATSADAGIKCNGPWQVVAGSEIATPYCGDEYLAQVARSYGIRVSGRTIRRSYSTKSEICQFIGHDYRISDICIGFRYEYDGGRGGKRR